MSYDPHYPLGTPVNRKPGPAARKVEGRPNWFLDAHDLPFYVEPDGPGQAAQPIASPVAAPAAAPAHEQVDITPGPL